MRKKNKTFFLFCRELEKMAVIDELLHLLTLCVGGKQFIFLFKFSLTNSDLVSIIRGSTKKRQLSNLFMRTFLRNCKRKRKIVPHVECLCWVAIAPFFCCSLESESAIFFFSFFLLFCELFSAACCHPSH